jgi:flavin-binding protein dodecin
VSSHVYKTVEVIGTSPEGITQAISNAVDKASKTLRNVSWFEVENVRGHVEDGKISHYQVSLKLGFRLED